MQCNTQSHVPLDFTDLHTHRTIQGSEFRRYLHDDVQPLSFRHGTNLSNCPNLSLLEHQLPWRAATWPSHLRRYLTLRPTKACGRQNKMSRPGQQTSSCFLKAVIVMIIVRYIKACPARRKRRKAIVATVAVVITIVVIRLVETEPRKVLTLSCKFPLRT